ncbi:PKAR [Symbiodinium pilosum]|uniref:PKAR protein n=1 Tax=Symbiodinium pilosum TaxID=2952 RepID=A0A812UEZ5_SYMPI|nr:PKAR [Symbiodinium pilosum]
MAWVWTETLAVSAEDRLPHSLADNLGAFVDATKVHAHFQNVSQAKTLGCANGEANRLVKFAAAAFQQAGIRREISDQREFEDGADQGSEARARMWKLPCRMVAATRI